MNCNACNDSTKYVFALWDGPNGTHGKIFECRNLNCEVKQARINLDEYIEKEKELVIGENESNGISMEQIKAKRRELQITISKISKALGISPSTYSCYETYREALPVEMVDRIKGVFGEVMTKNSDTWLLMDKDNEGLTWFNPKDWKAIVGYSGGYNNG